MPEYVFQKLNKEAFLELLDASFKSLSQKLNSLETFTHYKTVCNNCNIEFTELESSLQSLLQLCKDALKKPKPAVQLHDDLSNLGMDEEQIEIFIKQWETVHTSLIQSTVTDSISINPLIDMEWKFGVTSASSQVNSIGNVFLQIKLEVDQGNGRTKQVCFELQLSEFYAFLHEMERARASLDYLS